MIRVRVHGFTTIRDIFGASAVEVDVAGSETVGDVLEALLARFGKPLAAAICDPATGGLTYFPLTLNDELISSTFDRDRPVKTGDEIAIIFPVGGG